MTEGTNKGLFITVAIVIFGIFVGISYLIFEDTLSPKMVELFEKAFGENKGTGDGGDDNTGIPSTSDKEYEDYYNSFTPTDDSYFEFDKETGTIIGYSDEGPKDVVIPKQIDGVDVKRIGEFSDADLIEFEEQYLAAVEENTLEELMKDEKFVRLYEFMTEVRVFESAFENKGLTSVVIPSTVTEITFNSFAYNQLIELILPNSIKNIEGSTFSNNLLTKVEIPNSVTKIGYSAFESNLLTSVKIPNSVTLIDSWAFRDNLLNSVDIPNSVNRLGTGAFGKNRLTSVVIPNSISTIEWGTFSNNLLTKVEIPNSVTKIEDYAFQGNLLTSVVIPDSVTKINTQAFTENPTLKTVELPYGFEIIYHTYQEGATITHRTK